MAAAPKQPSTPNSQNPPSHQCYLLQWKLGQIRDGLSTLTKSFSQLFRSFFSGPPGHGPERPNETERGATSDGSRVPRRHHHSPASISLGPSSSARETTVECQIAVIRRLTGAPLANIGSTDGNGYSPFSEIGVRNRVSPRAGGSRPLHRSGIPSPRAWLVTRLSPVPSS